MVWKTTCSKFSFFSLLFCLLLMLGFTLEISAQTKILADILVEQENVTDAGNALAENELFAILNSGSGNLGASKTKGVLELQFPSLIPANRTTYIKIGSNDRCLDYLVQGSLGTTLAELENNTLLENHYFNITAKRDEQEVLSRSSNSYIASEEFRILADKNGNYFIAITPTDSYNRVRVEDITEVFLGAGSTNSLHVYHAYTLEPDTTCYYPPVFTSSDASGTSLDLLALGGAGVQDPHLAIDENMQSYSRISHGVAGVDAEVIQYFHLGAEAGAEESFKIYLSASENLTDINFLKDLTVSASNNGVVVYSQVLSEDFLKGEVKLPWEQGEIFSLTFYPGTAFNEIQISLSNLLSVSTSPTLNVHEVEVISDAQEPVILTCPQDISVRAEINSCRLTLSGVELGTPVATDNCDDDLTITNDAPATFELGETVVIWTVTDASGNSTTCTQTVTVEDSEAPQITSCPEAVTANTDAASCGASGIDLGTPVASDNCDNDLTITNNAPATFELGETVVIWTVTDASGNSTTCTQTVTVKDNEAPQITSCPEAVTANTDAASCGASEVDLGTPVATDNCDDGLTITNDAPATFEVGETVVTWTVTDASGNSTTCTQTVTVEDNEAPQITSCPEAVTANTDAASCGASGVDLGTPVASDNCDNDLTITNNAPVTFEVGETVVTWTVTDASGNSATCTQTVTVKDNEAPQITSCPEAVTANTDAASCGASGVDLGTPVASDNCDNDLTITNDAPATFEVGETVVTWTVTDASGNSTTCTQTVTVKDNEAPQITSCPEAVTANTDAASCNASGVDLGTPVATDNCDDDLTITNDAPAIFEVGETVVTWMVTDSAGNSATCTQTITVEDHSGPSFNENLPQDVVADCNFSTEVPVLTANDNCDGKVEVEFFESQAEDEKCASNYQIIRTWTATDNSGNKTSHTQTITVEDTAAPVLTSSYQMNLSVTCEYIPPVPFLSFEDNCTAQSDLDISFNEELENAEQDEYQIIRTWEVTDCSGNRAVFKQVIRVYPMEKESVSANLCTEDTPTDLFTFLKEEYDEPGYWTDVDSTGALNGNILDPSLLNPGSYSFTFSTGSNCTEVAKVLLQIYDDCEVLCGASVIKKKISKGISPNGDGFNDYFEVFLDTSCDLSFNLEIYNRWGAMVYSQKDYQNTWNGYSHNSALGSNQLPAGTYFYVLKETNNSIEPIQGYFYLGTKQL